jgi:hypothetical protein
LDVEGTPTNEAVGTGDGATATYYLHHHPIVSDSYTLYADGSALTETTHYEMDCDDYCNITSAVDVMGNLVNITKMGTFNISADITNYTQVIITGNATGDCIVICEGGCFV